MSRGCSYFLIGILIVGIVSGVLRSELRMPPPAVAAICAIFLMLLSAAFNRPILRRFRERRTVMTLRWVPEKEDQAWRLLGEDPPYVMEAADDLGQTGDAAAVPLLMQVLNRTVSEKPIGWGKMAGAMAAALAQIGDARALPLLRRLRNELAAEEIVGLDLSVAKLEERSALLRPAATSLHSDGSLLHPAQHTPEEQDVLLRPQQDGPDVR